MPYSRVSALPPACVRSLLGGRLPLLRPGACPIPMPDPTDEPCAYTFRTCRVHDRARRVRTPVRRVACVGSDAKDPTYTTSPTRSEPIRAFRGGDQIRHPPLIWPDPRRRGKAQVPSPATRPSARSLALFTLSERPPRRQNKLSQLWSKWVSLVSGASAALCAALP